LYGPQLPSSTALACPRMWPFLVKNFISTCFLLVNPWRKFFRLQMYYKILVDDWLYCIMLLYYLFNISKLNDLVIIQQLQRRDIVFLLLIIASLSKYSCEFTILNQPPCFSLSSLFFFLSLLRRICLYIPTLIIIIIATQISHKVNINYSYSFLIKNLDFPSIHLFVRTIHVWTFKMIFDWMLLNY